MNPDGAVLVAADTGQARTFHSGRAFDQATGALLINPSATTDVKGMGGMTVDTNGAVITKDVTPDVIHQGVGLGNDGYLITGIGGPVTPPVPTGASFYAPLTSNLTELVAGYTPMFTRDSDGWYWDGSAYQVASNNAPRFEADGLLEEPALTNQITSYNANPDADLLRYTTSGAEVTLSRQANSASLVAAGLSNICSDGNIIRAVSTAPGDVFHAIVDGRTDERIISVWMNTFGQNAEIGISGNALTTVNTNQLERISFKDTPPASDAPVVFKLPQVGGQTIEWILIQAEYTTQTDVSTSPIVTQGATASRAEDILYYPGMNTFLPFESTILFEIINKSTRVTAHSYIARTTSENFAAILRSGAASIRVRNSSYFYDVLDFDNQKMRMAARNGPGATDFGGYAWKNSTKYSSSQGQGHDWYREANEHFYIGGLSKYAPMHFKDVIVYPENKNEAWLDANWLCDGCFPS